MYSTISYTWNLLYGPAPVPVIPVLTIAVVSGEGTDLLVSLILFSILDTDVVEDGRDSPEAIIGVHVSNFMRLY